MVAKLPAGTDHLRSVKPSEFGDDPIVASELAIAEMAHRRGDLAAAQHGYARVLLRAPKSVEALRGLGVLAARRGERQQGQQLLAAAIRLAPDRSMLHSDLGNLLLAQGDPRAAVKSFQRAVQLDPSDGTLRVALSEALLEAGAFEEALVTLEEAIRADPGLAEAQWALARLQLLLGDFLKGWRGYRWGYEAGARRWRAPPLPEYAGRADPGCTVVVWADGPVSDQIMFARLLPRLTVRVKRVVALVDPELVPFFSRAFPNVIAMAPLEPLELRRLVPEATDQLAMSDLARILVPDIGSLQDQDAFFKVDRLKRTELRRRYRGDANERLVGLIWRGAAPVTAKGPTQRRTLVDLKDLTPILTQPRLRFVSLQPDADRAELEEVNRHFGVELVGESSETPIRSLEDMAARLVAMDHVVSIDSPAAHLAGALGVRTHLLLPSLPDWRWGLQGVRTPWYDTLRLYRRPRDGDWRVPLSRLAMALTSR